MGGAGRDQPLPLISTIYNCNVVGAGRDLSLPLISTTYNCNVGGAGHDLPLPLISTTYNCNMGGAGHDLPLPLISTIYIPPTQLFTSSRLGIEASSFSFLRIPPRSLKSLFGLTALSCSLV